MLPRVPVTGRETEFVLIGVVTFRDGKISHEHIHWDQTTVLSQLGLLDHPVAAAGVRSAAQLLKLASLSSAEHR